MATQVTSRSRVAETSLSEQDLAYGEREATAEETTLLAEAGRVEREVSEHASRLSALRVRLEQVEELAGAGSVQSALAKLSIPSSPPSAWAAAMEARSAALAARQEAHEALRADTARRAAELALLGPLTKKLERQLAQAEARRSEAAERDALAKTVVSRPPLPLHDDAPILLTRPSREARNPAERRAHRRVSVTTEVSLESDSNFFTGFAEDISSGGLFVASHSYSPIGTPVDVAFSLGGQRIAASAVVRWVRELDDKNPETMPGMGLQFTAIRPEAVAAVVQFVQSREPIFFTE